MNRTGNTVALARVPTRLLVTACCICGSWHWAVGTSFVLYHLATGRHHTIYARAYDDGGNADKHVARYTFYVTPGALG